MRLFLVRHGETDSNERGLALGRADIPLNARGRRQVERLALAFRNEPIAAVYASPLQRCLDTAGAIAEPLGIEVRIDDALIEMDIGEAEGLTFAEVRSKYPGLLERWVSPDGPSHALPGGERLVDVQERAWRAIVTLQRRHPEETVVAVTHNFVILSILTRALGIELAQFRRLRHSVAAISELDFAPERVQVIRLNDTCHLENGD